MTKERKQLLRYEWTCQRCGAVEMCEPDYQDQAEGRETRPRGWGLLQCQSGNGVALLCGKCMNEFKTFLRGVTEDDHAK